MAVINRRKLTGTGVSPSHVEEFLDTLDAGLDEQLNILMDGAPDGTAGTPVTWGFQLVSIKGDAVAESHWFGAEVFDGTDPVTTSSDGTLGTVTAGTLTVAGGDGTASITGKTDANGKFTCSLDKATPGTVTVACKCGGFGMPTIDCREMDEVVFS